MIGPIINSCAIITGGIIGAYWGRYIPKRLKLGLPATFGLTAISIGITMIIKAENMPVVVMALILGTAIGELIYLETGVKKLAIFAQSKLTKFLPIPEGISQQEFSRQIASLIVLFAASGLGVVGAMTEGLNGNYQLLLIKAMIDFMAAMIFATTLGPAVIYLFIVQLIVQSILFALSGSILPYMDAIAYADFSSVGGIIMLAVGFRIVKIMDFAVVNFLPALFLVIPFSHLWRYFFAT